MPLFYKTQEVKRTLTLIDIAVTAGGLVWLNGDAGLGKSYLAEQIERMWKITGKRCIHVRYPNQPSHLIPALAASFGGKASTIEDVASELKSMANGSPLLLYVDDIPAGKPVDPLLKLMSTISRVEGGFGMVLASTSQADDLFSFNHVPTAVQRHPTFMDAVTLEPLSETEMMEFLAAALPAMEPVTAGYFQEPSPNKASLEIARLLHKESRGVFLSLTMLIRLLAPLPHITLPKVREMIQRRHGH